MVFHDDGNFQCHQYCFSGLIGIQVSLDSATVIALRTDSNRIVSSKK